MRVSWLARHPVGSGGRVRERLESTHTDSYCSQNLLLLQREKLSRVNVRSPPPSPTPIPRYSHPPPRLLLGQLYLQVHRLSSFLPSANRSAQRGGEGRRPARGPNSLATLLLHILFFFCAALSKRIPAVLCVPIHACYALVFWPRTRTMPRWEVERPHTDGHAENIVLVLTSQLITFYSFKYSFFVSDKWGYSFYLDWFFFLTRLLCYLKALTGSWCGEYYQPPFCSS